MIRYLFITTNETAAWGGSEELWSQAAVRLAKQGYKVSASVPAWADEPPQLKALANSGVHIIPRHVQVPTLAQRAWGRLAARPVTRPDPFQAAIDVASPECIVISNGCVWPSPDLANIVLAARIPFVNIAQAHHVEWFPGDRQLSVLRPFSKAAKMLAFVSLANLRLAETHLGEPIDNGIVVANPYSVPFNTKLPWPERGIGPNTRLACVARLDPRAKGQDLLFEVLSTRAWQDRSWTLSLFGAGPHRDALARMASNLGIQSKIKFHGHVSDIVAIWRDHHALILPSRYEGLPLSIVEAMMCSRPIITTNVAGNAELVEDGISGFVAETPSVSALRHAMERAWILREEWPQYGQRARERVRSVLPRDPVGVFVEHLSRLERSAV